MYIVGPKLVVPELQNLSYERREFDLPYLS